jgi:hypothetical protein
MASNISTSLTWISFATRKIINLALAALQCDTITRPVQSRREKFRVVATLHRYYVPDLPAKIAEDYSSDDGSEHDADTEVEDLRDVDDQNMDFSLELDTDLNAARIFDAELDIAGDTIGDDLDQSQYSCDDSLDAHNATDSDLDVTYTITADVTNSDDIRTDPTDSDDTRVSVTTIDAIQENINATDFLEVNLGHESSSEDPNLSYMEVSGFNSGEGDDVLMCRCPWERCIALNDQPPAS